MNKLKEMLINNMQVNKQTNKKMSDKQSFED